MDPAVPRLISVRNEEDEWTRKESPLVWLTVHPYFTSNIKWTLSYSQLQITAEVNEVFEDLEQMRQTYTTTAQEDDKDDYIKVTKQEYNAKFKESNVAKEEDSDDDNNNDDANEIIVNYSSDEDDDNNNSSIPHATTPPPPSPSPLQPTPSPFTPTLTPPVLLSLPSPPPHPPSLFEINIVPAALGLSRYFWINKHRT
jgi:hypothetical protein